MIGVLSSLNGKSKKHGVAVGHVFRLGLQNEFIVAITFFTVLFLLIEIRRYWQKLEQINVLCGGLSQQPRA